MKSEYKDKHGNILSHGDVVEFYYSADYGYPRPEDDLSDFTRMVDIVFFDETDGFFRLCSDIGRSAKIWEHNEECSKIGSVWENPELIATFPPDWIKATFGTA